MTRIFYTDYGADADRIAKIEKLFSVAHDAGIEICRTNLFPISSAYKTLPLPAFLRRPDGDLVPKLHIKDADWELVKYASEALRLSRPSVNVDLGQRTMNLYKAYIQQELEEFDPKLVFIWHQFTSYHYIIENWCKQREIPIIYGENGVLPLSWCFEFGGQMGESWIAARPAQFASQPIDDDDRALAVRYIDYAIEHRLNRKGAGKSLEEVGLAERLAANEKPVLLYAGINDEKTGVRPFSILRTQKHSPAYKSTEEGLAAVVAAAEANDWLVLYKQHPSRVGKDPVPPDTDHLLTVDGEVDLLELMARCDVVLTLVSQTAYMALLHDKPCVLMGRMQLSGSGLVHDAVEREQLEDKIKQALDTGFTARDNDALRDHVARLLKYYVVHNEFEKSDLFKYDLSDVAESISKYRFEAGK